jgi:hypothetical protein
LCGLGSGCGESEDDKACRDSTWASRAAWSEAERELGQLRGWLREYDVWHLQSRNPDARIAEMKKARDKKWLMWIAARDGAKAAEEAAWDRPSKAVFASRQAATACEQAASLSPPVQKRGGADSSGDEPDDVMVLDWYTPGRRALAACGKAAEAGASAWTLCGFKEPTSAEEKALEETTYSFF